MIIDEIVIICKWIVANPFASVLIVTPLIAAWQALQAFLWYRNPPMPDPEIPRRMVAVQNKATGAWMTATMYMRYSIFKKKRGAWIFHRLPGCGSYETCRRYPITQWVWGIEKRYFADSEKEQFEMLREATL